MGRKARVVLGLIGADVSRGTRSPWLPAEQAGSQGTQIASFGPQGQAFIAAAALPLRAASIFAPSMLPQPVQASHPELA